MKLTPSRCLRLAAGLSLAQVAQALHRSPLHLAALERSNCWPEGLDWRAAQLYARVLEVEVPRDLFLPIWGDRDPWSLVPRTPDALACRAAGVRRRSRRWEKATG